MAELPPPTIPTDPAAAAALKAQLTAEAWARGFLRYKFHGNQCTLYDRLEAALAAKHPIRNFFALWSRRTGKSFFGIIRALETAIRTPNARILYLAPHAKNAEEIVQDQLPKILADCPEALRPQINFQRKELQFKNGSLIRFKGINSEKVEDLRGGFAHLVVLDEAGSMDHLKRAIRDVVRPMTSTTRGLILILTTPANVPDHDAAHIYDDLKKHELTFDVTLAEAQNPELDAAEKTLMLQDAGEHEEDVPAILAGRMMPKTVTARREYFCCWEADAGQLVIPEYLDHGKLLLTDPGAPPPHRDCVVGADWGSKDPSGMLFGYWDSRKQLLVIEDEWFQKQAGTPTIARAIEDTELALWGGSHNVYRVADIELRLLQDLQELYGITFALANKKDRAGNIDLLRSYVRRHQIIIHPRCVKLDRQLRNAIHDRKGKDFARTERKESDLIHPDLDMGHFDLVAALIYLVRFVHTRRKVDPYPDIYPAAGPGDHIPLAHASRSKRPDGLKLIDDTPLSRRLYGRNRRR